MKPDETDNQDLRLRVDNLASERGGRPLFEGLRFELGKGDLLRIDGPNGSGKSTLLRCLCGFFRDWDGRIQWNLQHPPLYVGHKAGVSADLTVEENVAYLLSLHGVDPASCIDEILANATLSDQRKRPVRELSEGQRKRVNLCRLTSTPSEVWVLDEPFSSLDHASTHWLKDLISNYRRDGGAVIYTSHQMIDLPEQQELLLSDFALAG